MSSTLLINEPPLQVLPSLAQAIGLNEALVLQQVHYWLNPRINKNIFEGKHWVHNTYEQWQRQFPFWSERTTRRTILNLEEQGLIVSFGRGSLKKLKYYTINYDALSLINFFDYKNSPLEQPRQNLLQNYLSEGDFTESKTMTENHRVHPSGHTDQLMGTIWPDEMDNLASSPGQNGPTQLANLACPTETTSENTYENTLPPLPVSCLSSARQGESIEDGFGEKQEEEEQENKKIIKAKQPIQDQIIQIWNQTVQSKIYSGQEVRLTEKREQLIFAFLAAVWAEKSDDAKIQCWQDYCALMAQSRFLAGNNAKGFKATLDWALVPDNAYKVLEGAIYDQPEPISQPKVLSWEVFAEELARTLSSSPYLQPWLKISINIAKTIGQVKYKSWFPKVSIKELSETKVIFAVEGEFVRDYIVSHFSSEIRCAIQALYPTVKQIEFQVVAVPGGLA